MGWQVDGHVQILKVNEFTDLDNIRVRIAVQWVPAQQCVEWPEMRY